MWSFKWFIISLTWQIDYNFKTQMEPQLSHRREIHCNVWSREEERENQSISFFYFSSFAPIPPRLLLSLHVKYIMNIYTDLWQRAYLHFKIIKWGFLGYFDISKANQAFSVTLSSLPKNKRIKKVTLTLEFLCEVFRSSWHDNTFSRLLPSVSCNVDVEGDVPVPMYWD